MYRILLLFGVFALLSLPVRGQSSEKTTCAPFPNSLHCKLLDDFESDTPGTPPSTWRGGEKGGNLKRLTREDAMDSRQHVYVRREEGNQFARVTTKDQAFRVILARENGLRWHLGKRPYLRWRWRAQKLPKGASERDENDTGGALYVTFDTDWLGRPKSIKYTYSSTLPVGTTVDFGTLKVLVVASKAEQGTGEWITHERNVVEDYRRLFGDEPDKTPLAIMMWGDSDTTNLMSIVDFDDLLLLSGPSPDISSSAFVE